MCSWNLRLGSGLISSWFIKYLPAPGPAQALCQVLRYKDGCTEALVSQTCLAGKADRPQRPMSQYGKGHPRRHVGGAREGFLRRHAAHCSSVKAGVDQISAKVFQL